MTEPRSYSGWHQFLPGATPWLAVSVLVIVADLWTKAWASASLDLGRPQVVNEYLDFTLLHNYGAAFSLLADAGGWQKFFFVALAAIVSGLLVIWMVRLPERGRVILALSLALIVGGALGNLYDRATLGYVVDFLHFHYNEHYWPAFNVADTAISIGVALMILDSLLYKEPGDVPAAESPDKEEGA
ncbi:MAG: signal peptidase II [Pseudomonadota bacterium]